MVPVGQIHLSLRQTAPIKEHCELKIHSINRVELDGDWVVKIWISVDD